MKSSLRQAALVSRAARRLAGKRWRITCSAYLAQHPKCECDRPGCFLPSAKVAHRRPPGNDDALFYAWDNLQALSRQCYRRKIEEGP